VAALVDAVLTRTPARPLVTFFDDATGERTELSRVSFGNWVAKTANLLQDGLAVGPGARVVLRLPPHWQTLVWVAACWAVGATAAPGGDAAGADVVVVDLAAADDRLPERAELIVLGLRPFGLPTGPPTREVPPGGLDYDTEVRGYADRFSPYAPVPPDVPALELAGRVQSGAELAGLAAAAAADWGLGPRDRVLSGEPLDTLRGILAGLLAPAAADASVVLCRFPDPAALPGRIVAERVTAVAGVIFPVGGRDSGEDLSVRIL
jgi:uncharacterized protein (TIGR03089 family)